MGITNHPNGISSFGMPIMGSGAMTLPVMGGNIPATGNAKVYFVDPANGSDGNDGLTPESAMAKVSAAYAKTVDKSGDIVYLLNDGNTSGSSVETATITWSNDNVHLVGLCAPVGVSQRSRVVSSGSSIVTPQLTVSGKGCVFANFSLVEESAENSVAGTCIKVTGERNYFYNVAMMNMISANVNDEADSNNLHMSGGSENLFEKCLIGTDTVFRSAANANIEFDGAAARNTFRDCFLSCYADQTTPVFVEASSAGDLDRWTLFERCKFVNDDNVSGGSTLAQAFNVMNNTGLGGYFIVYDCVFVGITDIFAGDCTQIQILGHTNTDVGDEANMMIAIDTNESE